jgi:hypothetical protein
LQRVPACRGVVPGWGDGGVSGTPFESVTTTYPYTVRCQYHGFLRRIGGVHEATELARRHCDEYGCEFGTMLIWEDGHISVEDDASQGGETEA